MKGSVTDLFELQPLEERLLFSANSGVPDSATALLPAAITALHKDINTVVDFGGEVAKYADIAKSIPGIADSIGGLLDFVGSKGDAGILYDEVFTPLSGYLKTASGITAGNVSTKLSDLGFSNVTGGYYSATTEFEWQFTLDKTVSKQFDLATSFAAAGFTIAPINLDVTGDFSLTVSFGVKSDGSGFFITVPDLDLSLSVAATKLNFGVEFGGGATLAVKDGEFNATISAENLVAKGGARITPANIADGLKAEIPSITPVGSIDANLPLDFASFVSPVLSVSIADVFAPGAAIEPTVTFPLTNTELQTKILDILGTVEGYAGNILSHPALTTDLPVLNQSVADTGIVAELEGMLKLRTLADDYFKSTATPDIVGLKDALSVSLGALGTLLGDFNSLARTYEIDFDLSKTFNLVDQELKGITEGAAAYGLEFPDALKVGIDATATAKFTLGLDLSDTKITGSDFYVRIEELSAGATVNATGLNLGLKLDSTSVGIKDGSVKLDALAEFTLSDPNNDGKITATEMKTSTLEIDPSGVLTAKLPFNVASTNFGALLVTVPDVFAAGAKPQFGFSFDIDSNLQTLILNTLTTTDGYASSVLNSAAFTTTIPLIEKTVGEVVQAKNIEAALKLHDVAEDYFKSVKGADLPTFIGLLEALEDHAKGFAGGFSTFYNQVTKTHELTLDLSATAGIKDLTLDFGAQAASAGLDFNAGLKVDVDGAFHANFTLGIDLTDTNFTTSDFYVKFNEVTASLDVHASDINIGIDLDGKSVGIVGGSVNLDVDATIEFTDPNSDGKITAAEVGSVTVNVTPMGTLDAELPLNVIAAGFPTVIVTLADVFATNAEPEVTFNFYLTDEDLQVFILDTLDTFSGYAKDIAGSSFLKTSLPLIDKSILELIKAEDIEDSLDFKTTAADYFADSLAKDVKPDIIGLLDALKNHNFGGFLSGNYDAKTEQFTIGFDLNLSLYDDTLELNLLDDLATEMGISSVVKISPIEIDVKADAFAKFTLGVDLSDSKIESKDFYAKFDEVGVELDASAKDLALSLNIGPASAGIKGGTAEFKARAELNFTDPNNDGKITLAELSGLKTSIDVTGAADIDLPLTVKVGSYEFKPGGVQPKIRATSANVFTERLKIDVTTADFDRIFNIGRMGPKELLDLVIAAGDWANQFRNADLFNIEIPFLNGVDLGDAFDFGLAFTKTLRANMEETNVQVTSDLKTLNLASSVMFGVAIGSELKSVTLPSGNYDTLQKQIDAFNTAFGTTWSSASPLKAVLNEGADEVSTDDDFMRILALDPVKTESFSLIGSQRDLKTIGFYDGDTVATLTTELDVKSDFKLSADAKFEISIDGSAATEVNVTSSSTSKNATLADLVADINTALATAKVAGVTASVASGKISFTGGATVGSFAIAGVPSTAFDELGLGNEQAAGMSELGSITETTPKFSTFESFVTTLTAAVGLAPGTIVPNYDPVTETFSVKANFGYNPTPISVPVGINIGIDGLAEFSLFSNKGGVVSGTTTLNLTSAVQFDVRVGDRQNSVTLPAGNYDTLQKQIDAFNTAFGVALGSNSPIKAVLDAGPDAGITSDDFMRIVENNAAEPQGFSFIGSLRNLKAAGLYQGDTTAGLTTAVDVKSDFKLSADAKFQIAIDGGTPIDVTVAKSATSTNTSLADLLSDINSALAAANVLQVTAIASGRDISFVGAPAVGSFVITGVAGSEYDELGLGIDQTAGLTSVASSNTPYVKITPKLNASLEFGYTFKPGGAGETISIAPEEGYISPAGYKDAEEGDLTPLAWDGKLSADAKITFVLDDGVSRDLTITKASTTDNKSMSDLVDDIKAAITANAALKGILSVGTIAADADNAERLKFSVESTKSQTLEVKTAEGNAARTDLGLREFMYTQADSGKMGVKNADAITLAPTDDARWAITIDNDATRTVTVSKASFADNKSLSDLLSDLNLALKSAKDSAGNAADLSGKLSAIRVGTGNNFQFVVTDAKTRTLRVAADSTSKAVTSDTSLTAGTPDGLGFAKDDASTTDDNEGEIFARARGGGFFIKDAKLTGEATVSMDDIALKAQLGFIEITAGDSAGSLSFKVEAELKDIANKGNTNFAIGDLIDIVSAGDILDIVQITASSLGNLSFSGIGVAGGGFALPIPSNAGVAFKDVQLFTYDSKNGFVSTPDFTPTFTGIDAFTNFRSLDFGKVLDIVIEGINYLSNTDSFAFLNYEIPVINISPIEFLNYAKELKDGITAAKDGDASSLQNIERAIEDILNLPASALTITIDPSTFSHPDNATIINFSLSYEKSHSDNFGMNLDIPALAALAGVDLSGSLGTLTDLVDLSATGNIEFSAYAKATLNLGIQITPDAKQPLLPPSVQGFLYDTSGVELGLRVFGQNLNFTASAGGFGLAVTDGTVVLDSDGKIDVTGKNGVPDGVVDNDYATIDFGLKDVKSGRYTFTDFSTAIKGGTFTSLFGITGNGKLEATLPVEAITPFGNISLDAPISIKASSIYDLVVRPPGIKPITFTAPDIKDFIPETPGIIQLLRDPSILLDGVDNALYRVQQGLDSQTAQNLPLIGNRLGEGAQMIEEFRSGLLARLTEQLRGAGDKVLDNIQDSMFKLFHTDLKILQDLNGDKAITKADIAYTFRKVDGTLWVDKTDAPKLQDAVQFDFRLGQTYTAPIPDLKVDFAVPGLSLKVDATPEVSISWDLYFGFGVSVTDFFYLPTEHVNVNGKTISNELEVNFDVFLTAASASTPSKATGSLFFLELEAVDAKLPEYSKDAKGNYTSVPDADGKYSRFNGKFAVNLQEPDTAPAKVDGRLTMPELFKRGGAQKPLVATLGASADVDLALTLRFKDISGTSIDESKVFPKLYADFHLDWEWKLGDKTVPKPSVGLYNINLDLGSFISDFLGPIAEKINDIIKPFDPILDALDTRIPVLSDFMGRKYTVLDLAADFGNVDRRFIDAVYDVRALVKLVAEASIEAKSLGAPIKMLIGNLPDLTKLDSAYGGLLDLVKSGSTSGTKAAASGLGGGSSPKTEAAFKKSTSATGGGFQFPILKPENILKLLTGKGDVTLVAYDIPKLEVKMEMSKSFRIYGPLVGTFRGEIGAWMDLAVGFDTKGLNQYKISGDPLDVLDGFYISDRKNADGTGEDVPEAGLFGEIAIGGGLDIGIARAGIEGIFRATADLDLNDPNDDGKIRASEIYSLLTYKTPDGKSYGPLNLGSITLKGTVGARAYVDINLLFGWKNVWQYRTPTVTIFEKTFSAPRPQPTLAKVTGGNLALSGGPTAADRAFGSTTDVGEKYIVSGSGGNVTVTFENTGITQTYSGVTSLSFNGGKGDDVLDVRNFTGSVNFIGGEGNDTVFTAKGGGTYDMGTGNDIIYGNVGVDKISGGAGADTIYGGDGNDILEGGDGNDSIVGGKGDDTYVFGDGWGTDSLDVDDITSDTSTFAKASAAGNDTLDFSKATSALTIAVGSTSSRITQGKNSLTLSDENGTVGKIIAGSAEDQITINSSKNALTLDGGVGADTYSFGFGRIAGEITIEDSGGGTSGYADDLRDTIVITPLISAPITLFDAKVTSAVPASGADPARTERVNFGNTIENMVIDAPKSNITVGDALDFIGEVRLKAQAATIGYSITANHVRVESKATVDIAAFINGRYDGNVEVIVSGGDILLSKQVLSSAGLSSTAGDGGGVIQLMSMGGEIKATGGDVKASYGSLLLLGTKGSIGTAVAPIKTEVENIAARTTGDGTVYIIEEDGVFVSEVAGIKGINVKSGDITLLNKDNVLHFLEGAKSGGGDLTFTSNKIQIDADLESKGSLRGGDLTIQPMNTNIEIGIGDGRAGEFSIGTSEIAHFLDGFGSIAIGRADGTHDINIGDVEFIDPIIIRNPILGGHITQDGEIVASDDASITVLGSGHTITLGDQTSVGTINIVDSAIIPEAASVTLTSTGGGININFDIDGSAGVGVETLTLDAQGGPIFIQGNVGSFEKLGRLVIKNATSVQFEGSVNVGDLIINDVTVVAHSSRAVTLKGNVTADSIDLQTAGTVDFRSAVTTTGDIKHTTGSLNTVLFQGAVNAAKVELEAQTLIDFIQSLTAPVIDVTTTGLAGDIQFRQTVTSTTSLTANSQDDITFGGPVIAAELTITNATDASFQGTVQVASISVSAGIIGFTSSLTTTGTAAVNMLTATGGTLTIGGTLNAAGALEASASGLISIVGAATAKSAELDGNGISYQSFTTPGSGNLTLTAASTGSITATSTTTVGGDFRIERASTVTLNGTINVTGAFVQSEALGLAAGTTTLATTNAASVNIAATNISLSGAMTTSGAAGTTLKAAPAGSITANAGVNTLAGPLTVSQAATVTFNAAVDVQSANVTSAQSIVVANGASFTTAGNAAFTTTSTTVGELKFTGAFNVGNDATLTAARALTFQDAVTVTGILNVPASTSITLSGVTSAAAATLNATNTVSIGIGGVSTTTGALTITTTAAGAGNGVTSSGPIGAAAALAVTTPRGLALNGTVLAASISLDAASISLPSTVEAAGAITLRAATTGNITLGSTLTSTSGTLVINRAKDIAFTGLVSAANVAIGTVSPTITSIAVGAGGIQTTGNISLITTTSGVGNAITALGPITTGAGATTTITSPRGVDLDGVVTTGTLTVNGAAISTSATIGTTTATFTSSTTLSVGANITTSGTLTVSGATDASFLAAVNAGTFNVSGTNSLTLNADVTLTADATISTAGDIAFQGKLTVAGALSIPSTQDVSFGGRTRVGSASIGSTAARNITTSVAGFTSTLGTSLTARTAGASVVFNGAVTALTGTLSVNTVGALTTSAAVSADSITGNASSFTFGGPVTTDVGAITLDVETTGVGQIDFTSTINSAQNIAIGVTRAPLSISAQGAVLSARDILLRAKETINAASSLDATRDVSLTTTTATAGESRVLGTVRAGRDLILDVPRDAFFQSVVTVAGKANIGAARNLQFQAPLNVTGALVQVAGSGTASYVSISAASADVNSTNITVSGNLTTTSGDASFTAAANGDLVVTGLVSVAGQLFVDQADDIIFSSAVTAASVDIGDIAVRTISLNNTLTATTNNIELAATGNIALSGAVATPQAFRILNGSAVTLGGAVTSNLATFNAASLSTTGDVSGTTGVTMNFTGAVGVTGNIHAANGAWTVTNAGAITVSGTATALSANINAASLSIGGTYTTTTGGATIGTTGNLALNGIGSFAGALNITKALGVSFAHDVTASSITIANTASVTAVGTVTGTNGITTTVTGAINVTGAVAAPSGTWSIPSAGAVSVTGTATAQAADLNGVSLTIGGAFTTTVGGATLTFSGNIALNGDSDIAGALVIDQALGITFAQDIDAASMTVTNATTLTAKGVTTLDTSAAISITGDLTFEKDITAGTSFVVSSVRDASFTGKLTAATVNIGATAARIVTFSGNGLLASGDVTINSNVAGGGVNLNAAIESASGTLSVTSLTPLNTTSSLRADRIVAVASGFSLGGLLNADGAGAVSGIQLDVLSAGNGTIVLTGMVVSSADTLIGQTTRPASVNLGGVTTAGTNLAVTAAETITLGANVTTTTGDIFITTTSTTLGEIRALAGVTAGRDLTVSAARDAVFQGAVIVADDATIVTAANTSFQSTLTVGDVLTQTAGSGTTSFASVSAASSDLNAATIIATGTFNATTGSATFTADANGRVEITSALNVATSLLVDRAALVSFGASVTTADVTITAGQLSVIGDLRAQTGGINIATTSDVTVGGLTSAAQSLSITGSEDVTLTGTVTATNITVNSVSFLAGNTVTTTVGDLDFTTSGNIRVVGVATVADDLIVHGAANVTFQGQTLVANLLRQIDGTGVTRFEGVTQASTIAVKAANQFVAGSTFRALTGSITIESEEIDFLGGTNTVQGNSELVLRSYLAGTSIDIGSPTPSAILDLSDADLNALRDGFTQITIGRAEDAAGAMVIGSSIFKDNTAFYAGSIVVERNTLTGQQLTVLESLEMTARTGSITTNDDIDATDATLTARDTVTVNYTLQAPDFIIVTAGTDGSGDISVTTEGTLEAITAGADITLTAGESDGGIFITGLVNGDDDLTFTAKSGSIHQTAGLTTGTDLILLAEDGIKLITQVDHITGRVTGSGDFLIDDTNTDPAHFLNLGNPAIPTDGLFTADGDIRINVAANANAFRVEANGGLYIDVDGDVFVGTVNGSPTIITGTILLDEDRTTFGENIEFAGNVRLLRDITLTSNGGDIIISGRVNSTLGSNFKLTLDAGDGDIFIGGPIGSGGLTPVPIGDLTVVEADSVVFGDESLDQASIRVMGDIEINANAIEFNSPNNSVRTLNGGTLTLLPLSTSVAIDIGAPTGGIAVFALGDDDLSALGDSFSLITIGHAGGTHPITIESAQFRDDLVLNAESVRVLASRSAQSVNGLSVVNGSDDNSITINARTSFIQERRATISAGRFGDIEITADKIELDDRNRSMVRGFGNLTLQPFTASQAITLGGSGSAEDFDLTVGEIAAIGNGFRHIVIGRTDGAHAIVIDQSLNFSDRVTIQAPAAGGSIAVGNADVAVVLKTISAGDHLTLISGGDLSVNASLASSGFGNITLTADADGNHVGNLTIGTQLTVKNAKAAFNTVGGNITLSGENVTIGSLITDKKVLGTAFLTKTGGLNVTTGSAGAFTITGPKTLLTLGGTLTARAGSFAGDNFKLAAKSIAISTTGDFSVGLKVAIKTISDIRIESAKNISVAAASSITSTKGKVQLIADLTDATIDGNNGTLTLAKGAVVKALGKVELAALSVIRTGAVVTGKPVEVRNA